MESQSSEAFTDAHDAHLGGYFELRCWDEVDG